MAGASFNEQTGLRDEQAYVRYLAYQSQKPFFYYQSLQAPAACPENDPLTASCRGFHVGGGNVDSDSTLVPKPTLGRNLDRRPHTELMGTSAFKARGVGRFSPAAVDTESAMWAPESTFGCQRIISETPNQRWEFIDYMPTVEPFQVGGITTRCNVLQYATNTSNYHASVPYKNFTLF